MHYHYRKRCEYEARTPQSRSETPSPEVLIVVDDDTPERSAAEQAARRMTRFSALGRITKGQLNDPTPAVTPVQAPGPPAEHTSTPPPTGGFARMHQPHRTALYDNLLQAQINRWFETEPEAGSVKLLLRPANCDACVPTLADKIVSSALAQVLIALNGPANPTCASIRIMQPIAADLNEQLPMVWLVQVPEPLGHRLLSKRVWSFTRISFLFFHLLDMHELRTPTLLLPIIGFVTHATVESVLYTNLAAKSAPSSTMFTLAHILQEDMQADNELVAYNQMLYVLDCLTVCPLVQKASSGDSILWLLFLEDDLFNTLEQWVRFRRELALLQYPHLDDGVGVPFFPCPCAICGCTSHSSSLCPLPALPGWLGPNTSSTHSARPSPPASSRSLVSPREIEAALPAVMDTGGAVDVDMATETALIWATKRAVQAH
ncbi:hypothetical protein GLOTRDRAFT_124168 [Gloeophyllum trabeum ATCC 11539]|uniref:Uncharacterized protein n=1 Tax=Gloeophyllum trabeum (strain ATCC 11539 / FP-39264 / Madison 617) TaxID=670483 RepID=S7QKS6_GLOTA|nr:uncharacterized protein GLOTRDRAFT_124168 [Gloeophyllum trabeum ATCC 11539]EPQ60411.1 hypothetical protein GLOTRDRAFT_124168 [Gloeophyllum trabeum ATCC 11539]